MSNTIKILMAAGGVTALGVVVWFFAVSGADPTTDVTAPPLDETTTTEAEGADETTTTTTAAEEGAQLFELTSASSATFEIEEELRGEPNQVMATSRSVVGQIRVDPTDLSTTEIGTVLVNARTFESDSSLRDRAIRGPILDANTFEFIEFAPTAIEGLTGAAEVGTEFEFIVRGELTIRDTTQEVTFEVTATLTAPDRIEGTATSIVSREDFGLQIPSVPSVANVSDEVTLTLRFVAEPA